MAPVQPSASVAATGLGIRYIGDYVYATSGTILSTGSEGADDILLEFVSGTGLIISSLDFQNDITSSSNVYFEIKFNDETVVLNKEAASTITEPWTFNILIPPLTKVKIAWGTQSGATNFNGTVFLTGRVYGAE